MSTTTAALGEHLHEHGQVIDLAAAPSAVMMARKSGRGRKRVAGLGLELAPPGAALAMTRVQPWPWVWLVLY